MAHESGGAFHLDIILFMVKKLLYHKPNYLNTSSIIHNSLNLVFLFYLRKNYEIIFQARRNSAGKYRSFLPYFFLLSLAILYLKQKKRDARHVASHHLGKERSHIPFTIVVSFYLLLRCCSMYFARVLHHSFTHIFRQCLDVVEDQLILEDGAPMLVSGRLPVSRFL